ncbi:alpha/beta-hydrolase [Basidiobolus meristosporus CBS 931.73]|uniref:Alpha/beta-hydrolase n=1 Tax=Basidiobolus meristosporus CBS 931.73 TaxID=1314790 RepID=A0A1Y1YTV2_9FUNG|nr:alpha/beta-hydrolase [Basidiobolus meristosporus CBS 931.73]|eukprot:ORY01468.1 alpha/beta-hydrolase [Basidiobolus meristosporus CBS 931.73]
MGIFVLVHGAEMGRWVWDKLIPYLESMGHQAIAFDLPGSYENTCGLDQISLSSYVERTVDVVRDLPQPVFLVGHSLGGMVISEVGELIPDRIQALVYLTAFLPMNGQCAMELVQLDTEGALKHSIEFVNEHMCRTRADAIEELFLNDCTQDTVQWGVARCRPQAFKVITETVKLSKERFGKLRKVYISCSEDRCISPVVQKLMYTRTPCDEIFTLKAGHVPSLSMPDSLANVLASIGKKYEAGDI